MAVFVGSVVALIPLVLSGRLGAIYNVPYPILLRRAFGIRGATFIACIRGLVAILNCAVFNWIAGQTVARLLVVWGLDTSRLPQVFPDSWGFGLKDFLPFAVNRFFLLLPQFSQHLEFIA